MARPAPAPVVLAVTNPDRQAPPSEARLIDLDGLTRVGSAIARACWPEANSPRSPATGGSASARRAST